MVDIVHHDVAVLRSLGSVLSAYGYRVCMFASAEQYRRSVEEGKAVCAIIAVDPRNVDTGLGLGRAIMSSQRPIPVIFIGAADVAIRQQAMVLGAVAYVDEPVSGEMLISEIQRLVAPGEGEAVH